MRTPWKIDGGTATGDGARWWRRWGTFGAALVVLGACAACAPSGKIAASSKTAECRAELVKALETFSADLGLDFYADDADAQKIFDSGRATKSYARDGVRYTSHFGLEKVSGGCNLKFYKRGTSEPGRSSTTSGDFGTVALTACRCE